MYFDPKTFKKERKPSDLSHELTYPQGDKISAVFRVLGICNFPAYVNCNAMVVLHNCAKIYVLDL